MFLISNGLYLILYRTHVKYNVTPEQIIEWNDLPQKTKPTTPLTTGMQIMIYQPKNN